MDDRDLALECLRLACACGDGEWSSTGQTISRAAAYIEFVRGPMLVKSAGWMDPAVEEAKGLGHSPASASTTDPSDALRRVTDDFQWWGPPLERVTPAMIDAAQGVYGVDAALLTKIYVAMVRARLPGAAKSETASPYPTFDKPPAGVMGGLSLAGGRVSEWPGRLLGGERP